MINGRGAFVAVLTILAFFLIATNAHARPVRQPAICVTVKSYVDRFGQTLVEYYAKRILGWTEERIAALKKKCGESGEPTGHISRRSKSLSSSGSSH